MQTLGPMPTIHSTFRAAMAALRAHGYAYDTPTRYWLAEGAAPAATIERQPEPGSANIRRTRYVIVLHAAMPAAPAASSSDDTQPGSPA